MINKNNIFNEEKLLPIQNSETYLYICEWIEKNTNFFVANSITKNSEESFVSQSTLTRFAKKLGHKNFKELQIFVASKYSLIKEKTDIISFEKLTFEQIKENIFTFYSFSIKNIYNNLNKEQIEKYIDKIISSKNNIIFGLGGSGIVAKHFSLELNRISINSSYYDSIHDLLGIIATLDKNHHITLISKSFKTREILEIYELLLQYKIPHTVWTAANFKENEATSIINFNVLSQKERIAPISSKVSQFMISDIIYSSIVNKLDSKNSNAKATNFLLKKWNKS